MNRLERLTELRRLRARIDDEIDALEGQLGRLGRCHRLPDRYQTITAEERDVIVRQVNAAERRRAAQATRARHRWEKTRGAA